MNKDQTYKIAENKENDFVFKYLFHIKESYIFIDCYIHVYVNICKGIQCTVTLRERLHTHKIFTKDLCFYLNYRKFSIKSYVLDVY